MFDIKRVLAIMDEAGQVKGPVIRDAGMNQPEGLSFTAQCIMIEQNERIIELLDQILRTFVFDELGMAENPLPPGWEQGLNHKMDNVR